MVTASTDMGWEEEEGESDELGVAVGASVVPSVAGGVDARVFLGACWVRRDGPGAPAGRALGSDSRETALRSLVTAPGEAPERLLEDDGDDVVAPLSLSLIALMPNAQRSRPPVEGLAPGDGRGCEPVMYTPAVEGEEGYARLHATLTILLVLHVLVQGL